MSPKNPHGGRREGAGRPPEGERAKKKTSVAIDEGLLEQAEQEAARRGVSRNKVIEDALRAALGRPGGEQTEEREG